MFGITRFILRHQRAILVVMAVAVGLAAWQRTRLKQSQSLQSLVVRGDPRREVYERMLRDFGDDESLAIAVQADAVARPAVLSVIDGLTRALEGLDGVGSVTSATNVKRVEPTFVFGTVPGPPRVEPLYDPGAGEAGAQAVRATIDAHPIYRNRLISADGRMALIVAHLRGRDDERLNETTRAVEALLAGAQRDRPDLGFLLAGRPLLRIELIRAARADVDRLLYVALAVVVVVLAVAFRRVLPVVLAVAVVVSGVTLTFGLMAALDVAMNNLLAMVPALVLIIGSSVSMHLQTRTAVEERRGADVRSAVARALIHVGPSCFWASATTAIGFLGLITCRVPALRQCGLFSAAGVSLSFVVALGLIPAVRTLRRRDREPYVFTEEDLAARAAPSPVTTAIARFVERSAVPILLVAVVVGGACVYGITRLRVETNRLDYFRSTHPLRQAYDRMEGQVGGLTELDVLIRAERAGWLTPDVIRRLDALQRDLEGLRDVDYALSLPSLLRYAHQVYRRPEPPLSDDPWVTVSLALLTAPDGLVWSKMFLSADGRTARIVLNTRVKGSAELEDLIGRMRAVVDRHAVPGTRAEVTGSAAVFAGMVGYVVAGQVWGLLVVMGVLFVIMCFLTGRVIAGVVCLMPTVMPILMLYGVMALLRVPLNLHTSIVSALAAGIAIDNAIHFLNAFKRAYRRTGDYRGSVGSAIHGIGRPLIVNCVLIAGGLGAFTQGELLPITQFGLLLAMTMGNALIMGLFLLPALMLVVRTAIGRGGRTHLG